MKNRQKVLTVEDDSSISRLIVQILKKEGYDVRAARTLAAARKDLADFRPGLIILDRRLPDGDGLEFCREVRGGKICPAILFLTSKNSTTDKVLGLKMGGDDYLTKPFQVDELLARVEALFRRSLPREEDTSGALSVSGLELDEEKHECRVDGQPLDLWPKEFEMLKIFLQHPGKVISKEYISQQVWGHDFIDTSRAIEMSLRRLRTKLGRKGALIETVKGYGFKLKNDKKR